MVFINLAAKNTLVIWYPLVFHEIMLDCFKIPETVGYKSSVFSFYAFFIFYMKVKNHYGSVVFIPFCSYPLVYSL